MSAVRLELGSLKPYLLTAAGSVASLAYADVPFVWGGYEDWSSPHVVALYTASTKGFCSGVVVADNVVLTAAHCLADHPRWIRFDPVAPAPGEKTIEWRNVLFAEAAPGAVAPFYGSDLAIVKFDGDLPRGVGIATIVDATFLTRRSTLKVTGYGITAKRMFGDKSSGLIKLMSPECVLGEFAAAARPGSQYECFPGLELLAGDTAAETDACSGDSGGPLLLAMPQGKANWGLLGIAARSGAPYTTVTCGPQATIYTLIFPFSKWLVSHGVPSPKSAPARRPGGLELSLQ